MLNKTRFFDIVRLAYGSMSQSAVDGYNILLDGMLADPEITLTQGAYILATAFHETAHTMVPLAEYGTREYFEKMYDPIKGMSAARRETAKRMGNTVAGDGFKFRGRGFVQITWRSNYKKFGDLLGIPLERSPDLALDPATAEKIIRIGMRDGLFTGAKLSTYINKEKKDYIAARRIVNGNDKAGYIADYAALFEKAMS